MPGMFRSTVICSHTKSSAVGTTSHLADAIMDAFLGDALQTSAPTHTTANPKVKATARLKPIPASKSSVLGYFKPKSYADDDEKPFKQVKANAPAICVATNNVAIGSGAEATRIGNDQSLKDDLGSAMQKPSPISVATVSRFNYYSLTLYDPRPW
jgi:hypothetical protein